MNQYGSPNNKIVKFSPPTCRNCQKEAIQSSANNEVFWYCRTCKIELDNYGWEVRPKTKDLDSYLSNEIKKLDDESDLGFPSSFYPFTMSGQPIIQLPDPAYAYGAQLDRLATVFGMVRSWDPDTQREETDLEFRARILNSVRPAKPSPVSIKGTISFLPMAGSDYERQIEEIKAEIRACLLNSLKDVKFTI